MSRKAKYILLIVLLALLLFVAWVSVASSVDPILEWKEAGITEVDGVLYFPDGQPIRNYEQLGIYLDAEKEVK